MEVDVRAARKIRKSLRINVFPKGNDVWRVAWFGEVDYPDRTARSNQPSVAVYLSQITDPQWRKDETILLSASSTTSYREQRRYFVSVSTLVLLRIGDLWSNQTLIARPRYQVEEFRGTMINRETCSIIKAGYSFEEDESYVMPVGEHPWHMNSTHSYCARVKLNDGRLLIIPAFELIRFYFGSSSPLLSRLFLPEFAGTLLYERARLEKRVGHLTLAPGLPAASVHDIARIAFDPRAMGVASLISRSCISGNLSGGHIFPQCSFPFEGLTTLQAKGKWVSQGNKPEQTFVIFELLSCNHAFPYKSLRYRLSVEDADQASKKAQSNSNAAPDDEVHSNSSLPAPLNLEERDPSRELLLKKLFLPRKEQFPDLRYKPAYTAKNVESDAVVSRSVSAPPVSRASFGEGWSGERVRPLEVVENERDLSRTIVPDFLQPMVKALETFPGKYSIVTASNTDGWTIPIDSDSNTVRNANSDQIIDQQPRKLCVVDLQYGARRRLLTALEGTPPVLLLLCCEGNIESESTLLQTVRHAYESVRNDSYSEHSPFDTNTPELTADRISEHLHDWTSWADEGSVEQKPVWLLQ